MAEETPAKAKWLKAMGTSIFGLVSGAVLMYVSPLVNSVVKPSKPLANFAHQAQGLEVDFSNRSTNATQGWWDFGDGSSLEPFSPNQETVKHTYPRPGVYTVKLSLSSFLGDENERSVSVNLDAAEPNTPTIEKFDVTPLGESSAKKDELTAPVTVRVKSAIRNADLSIWSAGDERPLEIIRDPAGNQDRLVTFTEPGSYSIRLVAVNGKQTVEKSQEIKITKGGEAHAHVALHVTFEAVRVTRTEKQHHRMIAFPADCKESTYAFNKEFHALPGNLIAAAHLAKPVDDPAVRNVKVEIAEDKSKVLVSGELVKPTGRSVKYAPLPSWHAEVTMIEEAMTAPETKKCDPVMVTLNLPISSEKAFTHVPMPALSEKWLIKQRQLSVELRDHTHRGAAWVADKLPAAADIQMVGKAWHINAIESNGNVVLEVQANPHASIQPIPQAN